jgi:hypothetical protein
LTLYIPTSGNEPLNQYWHFSCVWIVEFIEFGFFSGLQVNETRNLTIVNSDPCNSGLQTDLFGIKKTNKQILTFHTSTLVLYLISIVCRCDNVGSVDFLCESFCDLLQHNDSGYLIFLWCANLFLHQPKSQIECVQEQQSEFFPLTYCFFLQWRSTPQDWHLQLNSLCYDMFLRTLSSISRNRFQTPNIK